MANLFQGKKHGWNSYQGYLSTHEKVLKKYVDTYYVRGPTSYSVNQITNQFVLLELKNLILRSSLGREIEFKIEKSVELDIDFARPRARTFSYSYHALYPMPLGQNLLRYCSPHDHRPIHHKHTYKQDGTFTVQEINENTYPHINEFFDECLKSF